MLEVCLNQILPDPSTVVSTSPQKGAITLKVNPRRASREFRGNELEENSLEGAPNERIPLVFICMGWREDTGTMHMQIIVIIQSSSQL